MSEQTLDELVASNEALAQQMEELNDTEDRVMVSERVAVVMMLETVQEIYDLNREKILQRTHKATRIYYGGYETFI